MDYDEDPDWESDEMSDEKLDFLDLEGFDFETQNNDKSVLERRGDEIPSA
jgi:hypothetical protein